MSRRLGLRILAATVVTTVALMGAAPVAGATPGPRGHGGGWREVDPAHAFAAVQGVGGRRAGAGVGVALIDSGVSARFAADHDRVVIGPDVTGGRNPYDRYGHGTFLASLIVGGAGPDQPVKGIAPGATLVSVKAARSNGTSNLGILMGSVRWVIEHRAEHNIRVLVLAVSLGEIDDYTDSPLSAVLEAAWASGIVVVVPSGNLGQEGVTHPGDDPWLVSVGASDTKGTNRTNDDVVASWSGREGGPFARPDLVAPGSSVIGARVPGSTIDRQYPSARRGRGLFVGSGTSMASALVAGAAAVVLEHHSGATPDDVKGALSDTARPISGGRQLSVAGALSATPRAGWVQHHEIALDGLGGTLEGMPWTGVSWTGVSWTGVSWTGVSWTGVSWTGVSWTGVSWTGVSWTGVSWTGVSWTGAWAPA
jgi:serine protease AprX